MPTPPVNPQVRKLLGTKQGQELLRQAGKGQELSLQSRQVLEQMRDLNPSSSTATPKKS